MAKVRIDLLLVERGLAESRSLAQRLIMAGQVRADGQVVLKSAMTVSTDSLLEVDKGPPFVSRGGEKLQAALATFPVQIEDSVCADVGASTGGFTDCLLQNGAARVYAIDVGQGVLHWKLRQDQRVVVMERTNARYVEHLPEPVSLVTIDASFISLRILLPVVRAWLPPSSPATISRPGGGSAGAADPAAGSPFANAANSAANGTLIALIKPQFEAGKAEVARGEGVIRDRSVHQRVLLDILDFAQVGGYTVRGLIRSPLLGPKGNAEFLAWLTYPGDSRPDLAALIEPVLVES